MTMNRPTAAQRRMLQALDQVGAYLWRGMPDANPRRTAACGVVSDADRRTLASCTLKVYWTLIQSPWVAADSGWPWYVITDAGRAAIRPKGGGSC